MKTNYITEHIDDVQKIIGSVFVRQIKPMIMAYSESVQKNCILSDDDMKQSLMLRVLDMADRYDPSIAQLSSWIYSVCKHEAIKMLRAEVRLKRQPLMPTFTIDGYTSEIVTNIEPSIEDNYVDNELKATVRRLFNEIENERERGILFDVVCCGKTLKETGAKYGCCAERVRQIEERGLRRLKKGLRRAGLYE